MLAPKSAVPLLLLTICLLGACGTPPDATTTPEDQLQASEVAFELESLGERFGGPNSAIWLVVDGRRHFVDEAMGATLTPARGAPESAAASMSAWWGGGGPLYYAEVEDGTASIYRRFEEEMVAADSTEWELLHTLDTTAAPSLESGSYCFSSDDGVTSIRMSFELAADGSVTGEGSTVIEDPVEMYFTSAQTTISGTYRDGVLMVDVRDEIEYDVQEYRAAWPVSGDELVADGRSLTPCGASPTADPDSPVAAAESASLCTSEETTYFYCPIEGSTQEVALCGSPDLAADAGYLQYRVGSAGTVSQEIPADRVPPGDRFVWEPIMYSGGWDTRVQFFSEDTEYQIYDRAIKVSMEEKDFGAGVLVIRDGVEEDLQCSAEAFAGDGTIFLNHLADILPQGEFIDL